MNTSGLRAELEQALGPSYHIERELAGGGMSHVFVASVDGGADTVVVKVLSPNLAGTVDAERFRREILILTQLHHPGIVPVLGAGPSGPLLYYTMPLLEGESLRSVMHRERRLALSSALRYTHDIADALGYAHGHNVVHRDIKPENVIIVNGRAVVMDFGISRAVERSADIVSLTETGFTIGTPRYMSPEQAAAQKHIDGRSDIYSLACVLYEMLLGEPPFPGTNTRLLISRHLRSTPPSPRAARPDLPVSVEAALLKALSKSPDDRYDTAQAFASALEAEGPAPAGVATKADRSGARGARRRMALGIAGAAVVAGAVVLLGRCAR